MEVRTICYSLLNFQIRLFSLSLQLYSVFVFNPSVFFIISLVVFISLPSYTSMLPPLVFIHVH